MKDDHIPSAQLSDRFVSILHGEDLRRKGGEVMVMLMLLNIGVLVIGAVFLMYGALGPDRK